MRLWIVFVLVASGVASGVASADSPALGFKTLATADKCLDILKDGKKNNQPILSECERVATQRWKVTRLARGYVKLTTGWLGDQWCLDIIDERPLIARCRGGQQWKLETAGEGYVRLVRGDNRCLQSAKDQPTLAACGDAPSQRWKLTSIL